MNKSPSHSYSAAHLCSILRGRPQAAANLTGSASYPGMAGTVSFYRTDGGVIVLAVVSGLPQSEAPCQARIIGFHIHEGSDCAGNMDDPFADAMSHYDPGGCKHPHHAGDLPPLFGNDGYALSLFLTDRFSVDEVIGRTIIIHDHPDDFTTQPSGNSGTKVACGVIRRTAGPCC